LAPLASAQTTLALSQPRSEAWYATVRGGSYADKNLSTILETRSSSDAEYLRRAFLKFDTHNTIPVGTSVTSATLSVTVKQGSPDATRRIGVYQVTTSWQDVEVTYKRRRTSTTWGTAGGDLGTKLSEQVVSNVAGTKVSFDITPLVQQAVKGSLGSSRYTRVALVDLDGSTPDSWRAYHTSSDSNTAVRPTLTVKYGSGSTTTVPPPTTTTPTTGKILRVLHYNIGYNGRGSDNEWDGAADRDRIVDVVVRANPDIISFNELVKGQAPCGGYGCDGVEDYRAAIERRTGVKWYAWDAQVYGEWWTKGFHNAVYSKIPFSATYRHEYSAGKLKTVGGVTITYNGRNINFMTTHFDPYSSTYRLTQAKDLVSYMSGFAQNRIVAGDFNDQPTTAPITTMTAGYYDAWAEAKKAGIAYSPPDNPNGYTRNSRIDYIFYSKLEQHLTLKKVQVVETRDANGVMPSDHRPIVAEFLVQ
jgi:endonuclease/exonuclease/phosphatase family metal-dependent hydrolase